MPVYDDEDDYDDDDDDRPSRRTRRTANFPAIVMVAGIIWIGMGSLNLIGTVVNLAQIGVNGGMPKQPPVANQPAANPQAAQAGGYCGVCLSGLIGLAFVIGGYQTVTGKGSDPIGYAIGSLAFGFLQLACGVVIAVAGNALPGANPLAGTFGIILGVVLLLFGLTLVLAGIFALMGRAAYKEWREANSPRARRRRERREWDEEDEEYEEEDDDDDENRRRKRRD
jgi:hypothetical protein